MMHTLNYKIHDILEFKIVKDNAFNLLKGMNLEYLPFLVDDASNPDLIVNLGRFSPSNSDCYLVDGKYHIKENYIFCKDSNGPVSWKIEISGFEKGPTVVNLDMRLSGIKSLASYYPAQNFILRPILQYKMAQKGYLLLHAAAVSDQEKAYLLVGRAGVFKTTLTMDFIRQENFGFMGDENVIVHKNKAIAYPFNINSFIFRCKHLPTEKMRNVIDRIKLMRYLWSKRRVKSIKELKIPNPTDITKVFILERRKDLSSPQKTEISLANAVDFFVANERMEIGLLPTHRLLGITSNHYDRYMMAYSSIFLDSKIASYWSDLNKIILDGFRDKEITRIILPEKYRGEIFNYVKKQLQI